MLGVTSWSMAVHGSVFSRVHVDEVRLPMRASGVPPWTAYRPKPLMPSKVEATSVVTRSQAGDVGAHTPPLHAVPAPEAPLELPAGVHLHFDGMTPEQAAEVVRQASGGPS